jgi:putative ABC transport system substrate-binding protein
MRRRTFLGLAASATAWPLVARAQDIARIAFVGTGADGTSGIFIAALKDGLREQGLVEGRDFVLESRWADGVYDRFPALVQELLVQKPRVILVETIMAVRAAQAASSAPIVMISINDPVGNKLVASLSRPGGNTTGLANLNEDLTPKLLELVQVAIPGATRMAMVLNPNNPSGQAFLGRVRAELTRLKMSVDAVEARTSRDLPAAFDAMARLRPDALMVMPDQVFLDGHRSVARLALDHRLALFSTIPEITEAGGFLSYGVVRRELYRRTAYYVKRILDGSNPGDLPIEQPTRIELGVNMKTAEALGITVPHGLVVRADRVIEP